MPSWVKNEIEPVSLPSYLEIDMSVVEVRPEMLVLCHEWQHCAARKRSRDADTEILLHPLYPTSDWYGDVGASYTPGQLACMHPRMQKIQRANLYWRCFCWPVTSASIERIHVFCSRSRDSQLKFINVSSVVHARVRRTPIS